MLKLRVKGDGEEPAFTALLTGDVEAEGEIRMLEEEEAKYSSELLEGCDILKTAHHGSDTSTTEEFLDAAAPSLALISCGKIIPMDILIKKYFSASKKEGFPYS